MSKTTLEKVFSNKFVQLAALAAGGLALLRTWNKNSVSGVGRVKTRRIGAVEMTHPALYVGTYKKYNEGSLYGEWVDLTEFNTYDDFMRYIRHLHKDERDPEFMFQDYEGFPKAWYSESGMSRETFNKIKEYWTAFDGDDVKRQAYEAYVQEAYNPNLEDFEERYIGTFNSEYDYVDEMLEEGILDPQQWIKNGDTWIFDHDAIWRNLDTGGDITSYGTDYGIAVLWGN